MKMKPRLSSLLLRAALWLAPAALLPASGAAQLPTPPTPAPRHEVRAVWLTTLSGLDWPQRPARTAAEVGRQQRQLTEKLDRLQAAGINVVLFQARIRSSAAYASALEPWDAVFSGTAGRAPGYDPLAFAIAECHRRGMELHAWVVAFPIGSVAHQRSLGRQALTRQRPELCRRSGDHWYMDPAAESTADYLAALCREVVEHYDVDGIHLDYIRYPEPTLMWNDAADHRRLGRGLARADWRRANVTRCVRRIHQAVKAVKPWVKLSCSPVGKHADLPRQSSMGWNARDAVCQDAQAWLREGLMDWLLPMMYFDGVHFYPFAADWAQHAAGRVVAPGLGIYFLSPSLKNWELGAIRRQLHYLRAAGAGGAAFFREQFLADNVKGLLDCLQGEVYAEPAFVPPMTWADSIAPSAPRLRAHREGLRLCLDWDTATDNVPQAPVHYRVYRCEGDTFVAAPRLCVAQLSDATSWSYVPAQPRLLLSRYAVTAVDAFGNESAPALTPAVPQPSAPFATDTLQLPAEAAEAHHLSLSDATGRELLRLPPAREAHIGALAPGAYTLHAVSRRGARTPLRHFWKE